MLVDMPLGNSCAELPPITERHYYYMPEAFVHSVAAIEEKLVEADLATLPGDAARGATCVKSVRERVIDFREQSCNQCKAMRLHLSGENGSGPSCPRPVEP